MIHPDPDAFRPTSFLPSHPGLYARRGKRVLDLGLALAVMPLVAPAILLLWLAVRLDGGPGLFAHVRIGRHGRSFRCWKIRTMAPDADRRLAALLEGDPTAALEWARTFKLKRDPRVTWIGTALRRTSLDELPQIWNVLRGEMSLVGPRPVTAGELALYGADQATYLALRPGVTGLWQLRGRRDGDYARRVGLDRSYGQGLCLWLDLRLIAATGLVLLRPTGS